MFDSNFKKEVVNISYKNDFIDIKVIIPKSLLKNLQKYGFIKASLNKPNELLKELREKIKNDKVIYKLIIDEIDKANKFLYLYNPKTQTIKYDLYLVNIDNENVNLFFRVTFHNLETSKNKSINKPNNITNKK